MKIARIRKERLPGVLSVGSSHDALGGLDDPGSHPADAVSYDNGVSGLIGDTVQEVIDELAAGGATGAAGGDLSGTYPNPSVVDDSHAHTGATVPTMGPLLLASDHAVPIVFDDILQASDGADFLYASEP